MKSLVIVCIAAGFAAAEPAAARRPKTLPFDTTRVEALFAQGTKQYDVGEYEQAIAAFRQAYALLPDPSFLFNIGQAYRLQHKCREATAAYRAYLRNAPARIDDDRAKVDQLISDLEPCTKAEEERLRRLQPPPTLTPRYKRLRWGGIATASAGALAIAGGVVFSVRAVDAANDFERACGGDRATCTASEARAIESRGHRADRTAMWLYAGGGAAAVVGAAVVLYTKLRPEYVAVTPATGGFVVSTSGRF